MCVDTNWFAAAATKPPNHWQPLNRLAFAKNHPFLDTCLNAHQRVSDNCAIIVLFSLFVYQIILCFLYNHISNGIVVVQNVDFATFQSNYTTSVGYLRYLHGTINSGLGFYVYEQLSSILIAVV